jgi:hypothetical protein
VAEFLSLVWRGENCPASAIVGSVAEPGTAPGTLQCGLKPGHPGPLHYDAVDRIWWSADGGNRG